MASTLLIMSSGCRDTPGAVDKMILAVTQQDGRKACACGSSSRSAPAERVPGGGLHQASRRASTMQAGQADWREVILGGVHWRSKPKAKTSGSPRASGTRLL